MKHIVTYSGEKFTPLTPNINQIHIEDIAHSLSLMCRANGHIDYFFSIAQHSLNCANEAKARGYTARVQLACLIHDASEAYISDLTRPVKQYISQYREIESCLQSMIYKKYLGSSLPIEEKHKVNEIDDDMLVCEFTALMKRTKLFNTIPTLASIPSFDYRNQAEVETEYLKVYYGIMHAGLIQGR